MIFIILFRIYRVHILKQAFGFFLFILFRYFPAFFGLANYYFYCNFIINLKDKKQKS